MADSFVLRGVKGVSKQSGTEALLVNPKRGGNTHQIREWWRKGVNTTYATCTLFKVTQASGTCYLAFATGVPESPSVRVTVEDDFKFTFSQISEIQRAALYNENMELIEHYIFPSIAGGAVVTVTPPGSADRPTVAPPATQIDEVTVSGPVGPTNGTAEDYTAVASGSVASYTYTWGVGAGGAVTAGQGTNQATITWSAAGPNGVTCVAGSDDETFDGNTQSDTLDVTVQPSFADRLAAADASYAVTVADSGSGDKYYIDGTEQDAITASAGDIIHFDLSDASLSGHPFKLYTDSTKTTEVTVGVEQVGTDLLFEPPIAGTFSYQCANHADMGGDITINA